MRKANDKNNVISFDVSHKRLIDTAYDKLHDAKFMEALSVLDKCAKLYGEDIDTLECRADVYEEVGLPERAVEMWFKALDTCKGDSYVTDEEIYEGLAVNLFNLGYKKDGIRYYGRMLEAAEKDPDIDDDTIFTPEQVDEFFADRPYKGPKLVSDNDEEDAYADILGVIVELLKRNDIDKALSIAELAEGEKPGYSAIINARMLCHILKGEYTKAEEIALDALKKYPDDIQILSTLCAVYGETGEKNKAKEMAGVLCSKEVASYDDVYRVAMIACENSYCEAAEKMVERFFKRNACG